MTVTAEEVHVYRQAIHQEATILAGELRSLGQRATTYHHLYQDSCGNHIFPLIAAHGALWAKGYFAFGMKLGRWLSLQYGLDSQRREAQLESLVDFADAFREINRLVCVDTYTNYHLVKRFGEIPELLEVMSAELLTALGRIRWAADHQLELSDSEKKAVFRAHFLNEQEHVVGPKVGAAVEAIDWPLLKTIALRPRIRFAYFPWREAFWFRDFTNRDERVQRGLKAFEIGSAMGWETVESKLAEYRTLPDAFFADSVTHFQLMKTNLLQTT